jgi:outer membrane protein OmpA-like peptidoglycan-associated protein
MAERAALEQRATSAEGESERIARELKDVQVQREALASETKNLALLTEKLTAEKDAIAADRDAVKAERDRVSADREAIKKERDDLAGMLKGALSSVADTTETARGVVVSLSGILFDVGKATLMPASQLSVAKLAGILMVFPNMNLSIEGYTDSTGTNELNMRLSADRARSVYEFLMGQGISNSRMRYQGFGPDNPVAPNDTETNRAKNRRVEVVLTQAVKVP